MTRAETMALLISKPYTKVKHKYFTNGEFAYIDDKGDFRDEEGCFLIWDEFWTIRQGPIWETDWTVVE